jgi:hypothetical protein
MSKINPERSNHISTWGGSDEEARIVKEQQQAFSQGTVEALFVGGKEVWRRPSSSGTYSKPSYMQQDVF